MAGVACGGKSAAGCREASEQVLVEGSPTASVCSWVWGWGERVQDGTDALDGAGTGEALKTVGRSSDFCGVSGKPPKSF